MNITTLPNKPGVYLFKNEKNAIIYIGKAKNIKKRVQSYFNKEHEQYKTAILVKTITDIEVIITSNEVEAFLLESRLIRQHKPKFNIQLKDSERYAYIKITDEPIPRIHTAREITKKGTYYGPYSSGNNRVQLIKTLNRAFKLRSCKTLPKKVCLYYHIGRCSGPCEQKISQTEYNKQVKRAEKYLKGQGKELIIQIEQEIKQAAKATQFERAKELRDAMFALQHLEEQSVEQIKAYNQDIFALAQNEKQTVITVFNLKKGSITNKQDYRFETTPDHPIGQFIAQYYEKKPIPKEIILEQTPDEEGIHRHLTQLANHTIILTIPKQGTKKKLLAIAQQNAQYSLQNTNTDVERLQQALKLPEPPRVIECFDISTFHGKHTVASMVQFRNGQPSNENYRRYKIKTVDFEKGSNDFASMREVIRRRYLKLKLNNEPMPDLVVIDGGKGQLSSSMQAMRSVEVSLPIISIAKKLEEVFVPGLQTSIQLKKTDPALHLLQRLRDEAHRFAITYHRTLREKIQE